MIDLHFHCLPGIDDGPDDWDEAVALCRAAAAEGTETIVATPHVLRDPWLNEDAARRHALIARLNELLGGRPAIVPGCEYFFSADALELWERGTAGPLVGLGNGMSLLVEFSAYAVPASADAIFHELSVIGVTPVIAHPERNIEFARNPDRLAKLVAKGALVQLTAGSLLGELGRNALAASETFFARRLVHLIASDAHSLGRRPPRLAMARDWVARKWGRMAESDLFETNPSAVLRGSSTMAARSPKT